MQREKTKMRENHYETPQREHSLLIRRSKSISDHSKQSHKMNRKNLIGEFSAASGDVSMIESPKDSIELSSITDENLITESAEIYDTPLNLADTPSSEKHSLADLSSPASSSITHCGIDELKLSVEAGVVVKQLRETMVQVLNSSDQDSRRKKLLDTLVNVVVEEFYGVSDEKEDWFNKLIKKKALVVLLSFLLWVLFVSAVLWSISGGQRCYLGPTPT